MHVERIAPEYFVAGLKGFEQVVFTESSSEAGDGYLTVPEGIVFAKNHGMVLQSAREAVAFALSAQGKYDSLEMQVTRTIAAYVKICSRWYVGIDDTDRPTKNVLLARAQEYDPMKGLAVSRKDEFLAHLLKDAEKNNRLIPVPSAPLVFENKTYLEKDSVMQVVFKDVLKAYSDFLGQRKYQVQLLLPETLDALGADELVHIRCTLVKPAEGIAFVHDEPYVKGSARSVWLLSPQKRKEIEQEVEDDDEEKEESE